MSKLFWTGSKVLDIIQNVKFSSEKLFLVRSKTIWTCPNKNRTFPKQFEQVQNSFGPIEGQSIRMWVMCQAEAKITIVFTFNKRWHFQKNKITQNDFETKTEGAKILPKIRIWEFHYCNFLKHAWNIWLMRFLRLFLHYCNFFTLFMRFLG